MKRAPRKLTLKRETIRLLRASHLSRVLGGGPAGPDDDVPIYYPETKGIQLPDTFEECAVSFPCETLL